MQMYLKIKFVFLLFIKLVFKKIMVLLKLEPDPLSLLHLRCIQGHIYARTNETFALSLLERIAHRQQANKISYIDRHLGAHNFKCHTGPMNR